MKTMKQFKLWEMKIYSLIKYTAALCISIIIGMLMLVSVYALPVAEMKANVARSSEIFNYEGIYPQLVNGYKYMQLDNFTDSIMLGAAIYDGAEGTINKAVYNYHTDSAQLSPELALTNYANEVSAYEYFRVPYERYWHGYLVPLKLLLLFFDYADIRILNFLLQNFLLFMIIRKLYRVRMEQYAPAFLIMVFVLNPLTSALSLQFSSVYYIVLFSMLRFLYLIENGKAKNKMNHLFFATGILTAYLDILTYPLVPFGILIVLYLIVNGENIRLASIKPLSQKMFLWGTGYGGMWSGKWLAGSILTKQNLFADALNQVFLRTSAGIYDGEEGYTRLDALWRNIGVLLKWPFLIVFLVCVGILAYQLRKLTIHTMRQNAAIIFFLTMTAFMPVGWILITAGHAYGHYWFTYKEFAISGFALLSLGIYLKDLICDEVQ